MNKIKLLIIFLMMIILTGCPGQKDPIIKYKVVPVPKIVFKDPPKTPHESNFDVSRLPIAKIDEFTSDQDTATAIAESIIILLKEKEKLEKALDPFRKNKEGESDG